MPRILALSAASLVAFYLVAGAIWATLPWFTLSCGGPGKGAIASLVDWIAWPVGALRTVSLQDSDGLSFHDARTLTFCPRQSDIYSPQPYSPTRRP